MRPITGQESARRWNILLGRARDATLPSSNPGSEDDPFDCSSVAMPSTRGLVNSTLQEFIHHWKQLDARKVIDDNDNKDDENKDGSDEEEAFAVEEQQGARKRARKSDWVRLGWHAHRLKLPENFDFATRRHEPPPDDSDGDRVVSLLNPSLHLSYGQELWKLFRAVPTAQELEADAVDGHQLLHTYELHAEMTNGLRDNGRLDGHALSRMRMNDRHGLPAPLSLTSYARQRQSRQEQEQRNNNDPNNNNNNNNLLLSTTIRLEIWRRQQQPKRGPSPDPHRMILEFLGDQTLLDVHLAIVELSEDDLWEDAEDDLGNSTNQPDNVGRDESSSVPSGVFFIEGVFYTCGTVDYADPIRRWIDDNSSGVLANKKRSRRAFLGIATPADTTGALPSLLPVQPMSVATLETIPWRLGFRYYHAHHGDVESALFASDVRFGTKYNMPYPIIHDIWSPPYSMAECDACQHRPAVLVTPPSCKITDGGPRVICERCYRHLKNSLDGDQQQELNVTRYSVWRDQPDLSLAASPDLFF